MNGGRKLVANSNCVRVLVFGAILGFAIPCVAGTYVLKPLNPPSFPKNPYGGTVVWSQGSRDYHFSELGYGDGQADREHVECSGTITSVWVWQRDKINDPQNPGQLIDDPLDNPPEYVISAEYCYAWASATSDGPKNVSADNGLGFNRLAMGRVSIIFSIISLCGQAVSQVPGRVIQPPDPVEEAKIVRAWGMIGDAEQLVRSGNDQGAIAKLRGAAAVEETIRAGFWARAYYRLARIHVKQDRIPEALEAYKATFIWDSRASYGGISRPDLYGGSGTGINGVMEYAVLLAKQGRPEDAKAMYYHGLRSALLEPRSRSMEPAPLLVVFDSDPEGVYWDYSPERLEAAACMVLAIFGSSTDFATGVTTHSKDFVARARQLAPEWFYPLLFLANNASNGSAQEQQLLAQADALARPGLEQQLVQGFRQRLADWREYCEQNDLAWTVATDTRPMTEGAERRKRMQCLRPNEQVLRRLSIERPQ